MPKKTVKNTKIEGQARDAGQKVKGSISKGLVKNILKGIASQKKSAPEKKSFRSPKPVREKAGQQEKEMDTDVKKVEVRVVGIGGGGGNIISELSERLAGFSSKKVDFVAANTDVQALSSVNKRVESFAFGREMTKGLGTGRNSSIGEAAARKEEERIKGLFAEKKDLFILVSSLGGGTGTGATPIFAKIANDLDAKTLGIFTLPFAFEGKEKIKMAQNALEKIQGNLNAVLVLPNDKIFKLTKEDTPFHSALSLLNKHIANSLEGLLKIIYVPGLINIDWADVKTTLEGKGRSAYLNVAQTNAKDNLEEFAKTLLTSPILDYNFSQAGNILFNIESSKNISLEQLMAISEKIHSAAPQAKIIFGLSQSPALKETIRATVLATGNPDKKQRAVVVHKKIKAVSRPKKEQKIPVEIETIEAAEGLDKKEPQKSDDQEKIIEKKIQQRRNALDIKKAEKEQTDKEDEKEKIFEIPAFLRRNDSSNQQKPENK
ncbi:MAG: cell division protein FtsZ [Candidatus Paceibacterota bacterium]|jgi:cell division protein FtsZ